MVTATGSEHQTERHERHSLIEIDGTEYTVKEDELTGAQLKHLGGVPADYQLFLEVPGPKPDRGIRDDEMVAIKSGLKFYGVVSGTLGAAA